MSGELVPLPETVQAIAEYGPFSTADGDLLDELLEQARRVREIVPACVGVSVAIQAHGATFTLVASSQDVAALDAVQYVAGGPCVDGVRAERVLTFTQDDPLAEAEWQLFARATAASSVASTLSLPVLVDDVAVGSVNLYASTSDAFDGRHEQVAAVFDAWAPGAVTNADLDFSTRVLAEQTPQVLLDEVRLLRALGVLMASEGLDLEDARTRVQDAARRAGVSAARIVDTLIVLPNADRIRGRWSWLNGTGLSPSPSAPHRRSSPARR